MANTQKDKSVSAVQIAVAVIVAILIVVGIGYYTLGPKQKAPATMDEWNAGLQKMQAVQNEQALKRLRTMTPAEREKFRDMYPDLVERVNREQAGGTTPQ